MVEATYKKPDSLILYYFPYICRGHPIRLLLYHSNTPFTDNIITWGGEEWENLKCSDKFEFGQVPVLEIDGIAHSQMISLLRYLGKIYGYYPSDPLLALKIDEFMEYLDKIYTKAYNFYYSKGEARDKLIPQCVLAFKGFLGLAESRLLGHGGKYIIQGEGITIADFYFYSALESLPFHNIWGKGYGHLEAQFPMLFNYYQRLLGELEGPMKLAGVDYEM